MRVRVTPNVRVVVNSNNKIGRVTFGKIAKSGTVRFADLGDVVTTGQTDGAVVQYQANTQQYVVKQLTTDGGTF